MASKEFTIFLSNWLDLAKAERRLKPSYFCVAYALSRFANEEKGRKAWPRTNRLANRSGLSKPTVTRSLSPQLCWGD
jgi:hypothetical protein